MPSASRQLHSAGLPPLLLRHFDQIAAAPDAIPRLRQFILDLAVRGKLVLQDPKDEPASVLLIRIRQEIARLAQAGERCKERAIPAVEPDEVPFLPPSGWEWVRTRHVTLDRGQTVPTQDFTYIDVTAINKEVGIVADTKVLSASEAPSRARKLVQPGDVIYSCVRPYLLNIAVIPEGIAPSPIASTAFAVLNGLGLVLPRYLWIVLRSPFMVECVQEKMRGQAYPAINDSDFALLPFPLPPLAEQHRIVAKVDELMALCDRLEAAQAERETRRTRLVASTHASLSAPTDSTLHTPRPTFFIHHLPVLTSHPTDIPQLRQTILNLAVCGKLVPQDPKDEPASEALAKAAVQNLKAGTSKTGRDWVSESKARPPAGFTPPSGWVWTQIGSTVERVTVGYVGPMKDQYVERGIPFLRSQNVRANRFRPEGLINISPQFHRSILKSALVPGDVVVVRSGNVGTACSIPSSLPEANCSDLVVVKRPSAVLPDYLCFYLNSLAVVHIEQGTVGVALTHFNTKSVAIMPLPLPPPRRATAHRRQSGRTDGPLRPPGIPTHQRPNPIPPPPRIHPPPSPCRQEPLT